MLEQLMQAETLAEYTKISLIFFVVSIGSMIPFVWIFGRIIALKKKPDERALWTAALSYLASSIFFMLIGDDSVPAWFAPLIPLPGTIAIFYWLRNTYRKGWVEDDKVTDGMSLANSDWRIGVGVVFAVIAVGVIRVFMGR